MADFRTPFSSGGSFRFPTTDERLNGFPCGPADRELFNGLLLRIESEINSVVGEAGLIPTDTQHDWLMQAIQALINAATGGNPAGYVLMSQARARLPIYPEVNNVDGKLIVTAPATGTVRVPGGVNFTHRGIFTETTAQTDFITIASKSYHLRWNPTDGFALKDLTNVVYNPGGLSEASTTFDSTYDDMLVARVITNSSNVATITNLANKHDLAINKFVTGTSAQLAGANGSNFLFNDTYDWARKPRNYTLRIAQMQYPNEFGDMDQAIFDPTLLSRTDVVAMGNATPNIPINRYRLAGAIMWDSMITPVSALFDARA